MKSTRIFIELLVVLFGILLISLTAHAGAAGMRSIDTIYLIKKGETVSQIVLQATGKSSLWKDQEIGVYSPKGKIITKKRYNRIPADSIVFIPNKFLIDRKKLALPLTPTGHEVPSEKSAAPQQAAPSSTPAPTVPAPAPQPATVTTQKEGPGILERFFVIILFFAFLIGCIYFGLKAKSSHQKKITEEQKIRTEKNPPLNGKIVSEKELERLKKAHEIVISSRKIHRPRLAERIYKEHPEETYYAIMACQPDDEEMPIVMAAPIAHSKTIPASLV